MSEQETVAFLARVPLLEGRTEADLLAVARILRPRSVPQGAILWRQGDRARELFFVVQGGLSACLHAPGNRVIEIGRAGPGDTIGEIGLF